MNEGEEGGERGREEESNGAGREGREGRTNSRAFAGVQLGGLKRRAGGCREQEVEDIVARGRVPMAHPAGGAMSVRKEQIRMTLALASTSGNLPQCGSSRIHGAVTEPAFVGVGRFWCDPLLLPGLFVPTGSRCLEFLPNTARALMVSVGHRSPDLRSESAVRCSVQTRPPARPFVWHHRAIHGNPLGIDG